MEQITLHNITSAKTQSPKEYKLCYKKLNALKLASDDLYEEWCWKMRKKGGIVIPEHSNTKQQILIRLKYELQTQPSK